MNQNAEIIFLLCSHLLADVDCKPLEPSEWSRLADRLMQAGLEPKELPDMSDSTFGELAIGTEEIRRIRQLLKRGANLTFELEKYQSMGISVVTRADAGYPKMLKARLGKRCPPLFYYAGDLSLAGKKCVGYVGSRNVDEIDQRFTEQTVSKVDARGYAIVSGGAKGVDTIAGDTALRNGSAVISYLADSMVKRIRSRDVIAAIQRGQLLLLSAVKPDLGFTAASAMMRNRYIYAQSVGTVVVRADYKKGGTWSGAVDCIKHEITPVFCWDDPKYRGNQALIKLGAIPIGENWDGDVTKLPEQPEEPIQLTLL